MCEKRQSNSQSCSIGENDRWAARHHPTGPVIKSGNDGICLTSAETLLLKAYCLHARFETGRKQPSVQSIEKIKAHLLRVSVPVLSEARTSTPDSSSSADSLRELGGFLGSRGFSIYFFVVVEFSHWSPKLSKSMLP